MPAPPAVADVDPAALVALEQTIAPTWPGSFPANPTDPSRRITGTIWLRPSEHARLDVARVRDLGATPPPSRTYAALAQLDEIAFAADELGELQRKVVAVRAQREQRRKRRCEVRTVELEDVLGA